MEETILKKTKNINVFNRTPRKICCVTNEVDYLGDGSLFKEEKLIVGELYTLIEASRESYGSVVYIKEIPTNMGVLASMFEELEEYDEELLRRKSEEWLYEKLAEAEASSAEGKTYPVEEALARLKGDLEESSIKDREQRSRKRISPFMEELGRLWEKYPDLRFGQLVAYIENDETKRFYLEDDKLLEEIKKFILNLSNSIG